MTPAVTPSFDSFSQNGEDVVLWRALQGIPRGRYIDVGANDPVADSVTQAFYERGWSGITVEPDPQYAQLQREQRPRDLLVEAAIAEKDDASVTLHVVDGTGLSTLLDRLVETHAGLGYETHDVTVPTRRLDRVLEDAGWAGKDIHFMSVDTEGSEAAVLESTDLSTWRPWILVVEATAPMSTEATHGEWDHIVTGAGYQFCLFDGLSRWYVAEERRERVGHALEYPACIIDNYTTLQTRQYARRIEQAEAGARDLLQESVRWRAHALTRWAGDFAEKLVAADLRKQLATAQGAHHQLQETHHLLHVEHQELLAEHHELSQLCHRFSQQVAALSDQIAELEQSSSWRITRPLRSAHGRINQLRHIDRLQRRS